MSLSQPSSQETPSPRFINGVEAPATQPPLVEGGIMRKYQVDGFEWLRVRLHYTIMIFNLIICDIVHYKLSAFSASIRKRHQRDSRRRDGFRKDSADDCAAGSSGRARSGRPLPHCGAAVDRLQLDGRAEALRSQGFAENMSLNDSY